MVCVNISFYIFGTLIYTFVLLCPFLWLFFLYLSYYCFSLLSSLLPLRIHSPPFFYVPPGSLIIAWGRLPQLPVILFFSFHPFSVRFPFSLFFLSFIFSCCCSISGSLALLYCTNSFCFHSPTIIFLFFCTTIVCFCKGLAMLLTIFQDVWLLHTIAAACFALCVYW